MAVSLSSNVLVLVAKICLFASMFRRICIAVHVDPSTAGSAHVPSGGLKRYSTAKGPVMTYDAKPMMSDRNTGTPLAVARLTLLRSTMLMLIGYSETQPETVGLVWAGCAMVKRQARGLGLDGLWP